MIGALSHAELVDLVVRQSVLVDELRATVAEQQGLIARLEGRVRDLECEVAQRDRDDSTKRMPGLKPAATPRRRKAGPRKRRAQLDYAAFRAGVSDRQWGRRERQCAARLVVEARLKGSGMPWARPNVNPLAALRGVLRSERWAVAWPLARAAAPGGRGLG